MEEQKSVIDKGGTMRLGAYDCRLAAGSRASEAYGGVDMVSERHRHRFEFNNSYREAYERSGMKCTGENPDTGLVEIVEIPGMRWYIGTQFHPEYSTTVIQPSPIFIDFIRHAIAYRDEKK